MTPKQSDDWEFEVANIISDKLNCSISDAQSIMEAQDFFLVQSWAKDLTAHETAILIIDKSLVK